METTTLRIRDRSTRDRPRDKLYTKKPNELSNAELLAMIIGPGNARCNSLELAQKVLAACGNRLSELGKCSIWDLMKVAGIGHAKACTVVALAELGRRHESEKVVEIPIIKDSKHAAEFLTPHLKHLQHEHFAVLFLRAGGKIIEFEILFEGGITSVTVDPRIILKKAITFRAQSIIVCHNHPSGSLRPSIADKALTTTLNNASKYMDIKLLDHIIIGETGYFSFADEGYLS